MKNEKFDFSKVKNLLIQCKVTNFGILNNCR